jgi:hypothetical protein
MCACNINSLSQCGAKSRPCVTCEASEFIFNVLNILRKFIFFE